MKKLAVLLTIAAAATLLVACGSAARETIHSGDSGTDDTFLSAEGLKGPAGPAGPPGSVGSSVTLQNYDADRSSASSWMPPGAPAATPRSAPSKELPPGQPGAAPSPLDTIQRQVISMASLSIEVTAVQAATSQVRAIAEGLGGFVEQLSSSGDAKNQQANITLRVPQSQFFTAMERLEVLGEVQSSNLGSEDVSNQFIDLKARLASALREEQSLLSLLSKAGTVTEILTIERELSRVRSEIERLQGQLNFLERRVELATISVYLFPPQEEVVQPPSANLLVEVSDVTGRVAEVRNLVAGLNGKVDRVFLSVRDDRARADVSLRVFAKDFDQAVASLERLGEVKVKELQQGQSPGVPEKAQAEQPDSYIQLSLVQPVKDSKTWLWWAIGGPVGGVALLAVVLFLVYRAGRRRGV